MDYVFKGPRYRRYPYEKKLAVQELSALTGREPTWKGERLWLSVRRPLSVEALRRLAFTSVIQMSGASIATQTNLLEQSALFVRNGNGAKSGNRDASTRKESNYLTHGLHRYKGKFYPQLCRSLLNIAGIEAKELVFDPFVGSGTTLVECALSGIDSVGFDLNPLAHLITATKTELIQMPTDILYGALEEFEVRLVRECRSVGLCWSGIGSSEPEADPLFSSRILAEECGLIEASDELDRWFPSAVCQKLTAVLRAVKKVQEPTFSKLVQVCLSDQIRSVSQQEPRDLRIRRRAEEIKDAPVLSLLSHKLVKELDKLKAGLDLLGGPVRAGTIRAELMDARAFERIEHPIFSHRKVDAVVTSPPYANALPYIDTDRLSLLILGLLSRRQRNQLQKRIIGNREIHDTVRRELELELEGPSGLKTFPQDLAKQIRRIQNANLLHEVGFRRRNIPALLYQYFKDMRTVMGKLYAVVKPGGRAYIVVGNSRTLLGDGEEYPIRTTDHLASLAEQVGWRTIDCWPITVTVENVAHVRNSITANRILVLERRIGKGYEYP